jgi:hypothetical protein
MNRIFEGVGLREEIAEVRGKRSDCRGGKQFSVLSSRFSVFTPNRWLTPNAAICAVLTSAI